MVLCGGCFRRVHSDTCEEVSREEVALDEETWAGTAGDLLASVAVDAVVPGTYAMDDRPIDVALWMDQDGPAVFVQTELASSVVRTFGFGTVSVLIGMDCRNYLEIPLAAEAHTTDGAVEVFAEGTVFRASPGTGRPYLDLDGAYADASFPETGEDPDDWDEKGLIFDLATDEVGEVTEGSIGWTGKRHEPSGTTATRQEVVTFAPASAGTDTGTK